MIFKYLNKIKLSNDLKELIYHSKNYISADLLTKGLAFLTLPIFTRWMTTSEYGIMSVYISFTGILAVIFSFGIRGAISRYYYEANNDFFSFLSSNLWFVFITSLVFTILVFIFKEEIYSFLNIPYSLIFIAIIVTIPQVIIQFYQAYLTAAKKSRRVAYMNIIYGLVSTILAVLIMYNMDNELYYAKAYSQLIGGILIMGISIWYLKDHIKLNINKLHLKYSIVFGLPIVLHLLSQDLLNTFDQVIINQLLGSNEAGLYSVAYKIGMIQSIISLGTLKSWTPIFYEKLNENDINDINKLAGKYSYILGLIATMLILFSKELFLIFADNKFEEAITLIPIIIVSYYFFFLYTIYVNYAFYKKRTKLIALFTVIVGCINIILNYILIPKLGFIAAAWTTLISYIFLFIFQYLNVKYLLKITNLTPLRVFIPPLIIVSASCFIYYYLFSINISYFIELILRLLLVFLILITIILKIKEN